MTRDEYLEALLPGVRQTIVHFVGTERERRARAILDQYPTKELALMHSKQVAAKVIKPPTPAVTDQDVEYERQRGEREIEQLREHYQEKIAVARANREADRLEFRRQQDEAAIPERREAILRARQVITDAHSVLRSFNLNEAVFNVIIRELGTDLTTWSIQQALDANVISLPAPTDTEQQSWAEQDIKKHNRRLLDMRPDELKAEIRKESATRQQQVQQAEADRVQKLQEQSDSYLGYPELPDNDRGVKLDSNFFRRASAETIRNYARRFGIANINKAIMNRR